MNEIRDIVLRAVKGDDLKEVYPSFDAVPVIRKSPRFFTVVGLEKIQTQSVIPDSQNGVIPFTAVFRICVLADFQRPLNLSEDFLFQVIFPRVKSVGGVLCEILPPSADNRLQKTVTAGLFSFRGFYSQEVDS